MQLKFWATKLIHNVQRLYLLLLFFTFATISLAQSLKVCGTDEMVRQSFLKHPELLLQQEQLENFTENFHLANKQNSTFIIPVVVHIIHDYGIENISDAQVYDALQILNEDFNRQNSDTSFVVNAFKNNIANCSIEFRLATKDPNGNCTNGINRIASLETYIGDDNSKLNGWPAWKYLNIWVVNSISIGVAGYTYLPGTTPANNEGILILHDYVGSIGTSNNAKSRILTHEVGHFFNLLHPWGSTNNPGVACGDDFVTDTPPTKGWINCNTSGATCGNLVDNVQNFMEYSYCSRMFTTGQKNRMDAALYSPIGFRNNLWGYSNLIATGTYTNTSSNCAPIAEFKTNTKYTCQGNSINFTDLSWGGTPTSYLWNFDGGTPNTSTINNPSVIYNSPGVYSVTLTVSNNVGANTTTKTGYINVLSTTATYSGSFFESYESGILPNNDWSIVNIGNSITWDQTNSVAYSGSNSAFIDNYFSSFGESTELISPAIDISSMSSPAFTFKYAYAQIQSSDADKLEIFSSTTCGQTWNIRYTKSGSALATTAIETNPFTPSNTSQWKNQIVNISPLTASNNVLFKFKFTNGGGNNFFLDDINITGVTGIEKNNFLKYYHSVESNSITVFYTSLEQEEIEIRLVSIVGSEINKTKHMAKIGTNRIDIKLDLNSSGMYLINFSSSKTNTTGKIILD
ncbi:MAG: PKD domain-containing protein [Bacteroidetes bacterium]|nr:PKD domain-containing protein [Bacteroidota bacterium]